LNIFWIFFVLKYQLILLHVSGLSIIYSGHHHQCGLHGEFLGINF